MKENSNPPYSRGPKKSPPRGFVRTSVFESLGPGGKNRGTMQQLMDRYTALGRDASRDGDTVLSQGFFQHAEHYRRLLAGCTRLRPEESPSPAPAAESIGSLPEEQGEEEF
jgi:hypothetical protein